MSPKIIYGAMASLLFYSHLNAMPFSEKHKSINSKIEDFLKIFDRKTPDERFNETSFDQNKLHKFIEDFLKELDEDPNLIFKISFQRTVNFMKAIMRSSMDEKIMNMLVQPDKIDHRINKLIQLSETMGETLSINFIYDKDYSPIREIDLKKFIQKINSCITLCRIIETIIDWHEKEFGIIKSSLEYRTKIVVSQSRPLIITKLLIKKIAFHQPDLYKDLLSQTKDPRSHLFIQGGSNSAVGEIIQKVEEDSFVDINLN